MAAGRRHKHSFRLKYTEAGVCWGQKPGVRTDDLRVTSPPMFCSVMAIPAAIFPGVPKAL